MSTREHKALIRLQELLSCPKEQRAQKLDAWLEIASSGEVRKHWRDWMGQLLGWASSQDEQTPGGFRGRNETTMKKYNGETIKTSHIAVWGDRIIARGRSIATLRRNKKVGRVHTILAWSGKRWESVA